jgi:superfamily II DNA or RNA helicase
MDRFPDDIRFRSTWRPYQARVLGEMEQHLDDRKLHVVAAPGSGKTVLGLEVVHRLDAPALILAPTLAIRDQWVHRLVELFLPKGSGSPDWISRNLDEPKFFNVATYQSLHSIMSRDKDLETLSPEEMAEEEAEEVEEGDLEEEDLSPKEDKPRIHSWLDQNKRSNRNRMVADLPAELKAIGVKTIVLDEAHHLRSSWWKSLTKLIESFGGEIQVVSLTATPPFDVPDYEWERYVDLCGPVDAQIPVPELVMEGNLCPHQDLLLFTTPSDAENEELRRFRKSVAQFKEWLFGNEEFTAHIVTHPWMVDPDSDVEAILDEPEFYSSMLIYLKSRGFELKEEAVSLISDSSRGIPNLDDEWLEILLTKTIYPPGADRPKHPDYIIEVRNELKRIGALEMRKVRLRNVKAIEQLLKRSISKLQSIGDIVALETKSLGDKLRMVVLTDFIREATMPKEPNDRSALNQIGVVPIFEVIRRSEVSAKLGILSGSLVVIPQESMSDFYSCAKALGIGRSEIQARPLIHDPSFVEVDASSEVKHKLVKTITDLFTRGGIEVIVGTKSLLGEGWDAPSINALIMASFVGSYMLSNQMRGRAIRSESGNPEKTANIWHLVCVEPDSEDPGPDYETMERRFKAFVGVSHFEPLIENGFSRLGIKEPPLGKKDLKRANEDMLRRAGNRSEMRTAWEEALRRGEDGVRLVEDIQTKKVSLPRGFVFWNTISALFWEGVFWGTFFFLCYMDSATELVTYDARWALFMLLIGAAFAGLIAAPMTLKACWLFIRHGPVKSSMKSIGEALLKTLCHTGEIRTEYTKLRVVADEGPMGLVYCHLEGGSSRERAVYLRAMQEILDPITNPRYLLVRIPPPWMFLARKDYHTVPSVIGQKKKNAVYFAQMWSKHVGKMKLVYTRNREGRIVLLRARNHSLSDAFREKSDRITRWK